MQSRLCTHIQLPITSLLSLSLMNALQNDILLKFMQAHIVIQFFNYFSFIIADKNVNSAVTDDGKNDETSKNDEDKKADDKDEEG